MLLVILLHAISWKHREIFNLPSIMGAILLNNFDHERHSLPNEISSTAKLGERAKVIRFFSALDLPEENAIYVIILWKQMFLILLLLTLMEARR